MAVSVARTDAAAPALPRVRAAALPWLAFLVAASAGLRVAAAWLKATPVYLPDEYMYSELGRSLSESARPLVRGVEAAFPSLLQPIVTAPFWLIDDVDNAYRAIQVLGSVVMSLAAPAAFVLARRAGLTRGLSLGVAAVAVTVPDLVYAGWMLAEPFSYPIVLASLAAGVAALERPAWRRQLAFVALAALAVFARAQFAVLPLCFALAVVVVGQRGAGVRAALRAQALPLGIFVSPLVLALAIGRERVLGIYSAPFGGQASDILEFSNWAGPDVLVLLYMVGFALVPGALLGLALAIARPRSVAEVAFASLAVTLTVALLAEAALFGALHVVQERYVFYVVPLLAVGFGLYVSRGWPHRRPHTLVAGILLVVSAYWPLAGWAAADGKEHSPSLLALSRLEVWIGSPGDASLVVAAVAALLCLLVMLAPFRPRAGVVLGFGAAIVFGTAGWIGAVQWDVGNAERLARLQLGADRSWIDNAGLGDVVLLRSFGAQRLDAIQMFWNRSVDRVVLMEGAEPLDPFTNERADVAADGALSVGGKPLRAPLLVEEYSATLRLTGATRVGGSASHSLWRPDGTPRLSLYMVGRHWDSWLAGAGRITVWAPPGERHAAGVLTMNVRAPHTAKALELTFALPGGAKRVVKAPANVSTPVRIAVCGGQRWQADFSASERAFFNGRIVSVRSTEPVFRPDPSVCAPPAI